MKRRGIFRSVGRESTLWIFCFLLWGSGGAALHAAGSNEKPAPSARPGFAPAAEEGITEFRMISTPPGLIDLTNYPVTPGTLTTITAPPEKVQSQDGTLIYYRLAGWWQGTQRIVDAIGQSMNPAILKVEEFVKSITVTAHYLPKDQDADEDGVPDWFEFFYYGTVTNAADSDTDGDGYTLIQEYQLGYHPLLPDEIVSGGIAQARFGPVLYVGGNAALYTIQSDPEGCISPETNVVAKGTIVTTPALWGNRYRLGNQWLRFVGWTANGQPQLDPYGVPVSRVQLALQTNTAFVAHYVSETADTDRDGIPDWYELTYFGNLDQGPDSDWDQDGLTLVQELKEGTCPRLRDEPVEGGIAAARSDLVIFKIIRLFAYAAEYTVPPGVPIRIPLRMLYHEIYGNPVHVVDAGPSRYGSPVSWDDNFIFFVPEIVGDDAFSFTVQNTLGDQAKATITIHCVPSQGMARRLSFMPEGKVEIRFYGLPGFLYVVERTQSLVPPVQWEVVSDVLQPGLDGSMLFVDPNPPSGAAYYRLRQYVP